MISLPKTDLIAFLIYNKTGAKAEPSSIFWLRQFYFQAVRSLNKLMQMMYENRPGVL